MEMNGITQGENAQRELNIKKVWEKMLEPKRLRSNREIQRQMGGCGSQKPREKRFEEGEQQVKCWVHWVWAKPKTLGPP